MFGRANEKTTSKNKNENNAFVRGGVILQLILVAIGIRLGPGFLSMVIS